METLMKKIRPTVLYAAEIIHLETLAAVRRAIRAGDLARAERWMKLCERHYRNSDLAFTESTRRAARVREIARDSPPRRPNL
jgi:hypothetical protein